MKDFDFLGDDRLVDAPLMEVAVLLQNPLSHQQPGATDLLGLPLSPACLAALEERLGGGEISALLSVAGESQIPEASFPGAWWTRHGDDTGRVVALLIEVAAVPEILRASTSDMEQGLRRIREVSNFRRAGQTP